MDERVSWLRSHFKERLLFYEMVAVPEDCRLNRVGQKALAILDFEIVAIAFKADSMPELQIQEAPDPIIVIAVV
jgi:hypothetical protein